MWRRMNTVSDCAGSKTTLLPEEYGGMIINETGTAVVYIGSLKKMKRKKRHVVIEKKSKSCFSIRVLGGRVTVYSMLCVFKEKSERT